MMRSKTSISHPAINHREIAETIKSDTILKIISKVLNDMGNCGYARSTHYLRPVRHGIRIFSGGTGILQK